MVQSMNQWIELELIHFENFCLQSILHLWIFVGSTFLKYDIRDKFSFISS